MSTVAAAPPPAGTARDRAIDGPFVGNRGDGTATLEAMVEGLHCGGCVRRVESALAAIPGVISARVNLSARRMSVRWRAGEVDARTLLERVAALGFRAVPFAPSATADDPESRQLLRALAVAGFAAANVMLLSVSVWSGLAADMDETTRRLFHWLSALIALPAIVYAANPFVRSALVALAHRALNMDVPITLGVALATAMSLFETMAGREHVYFDAAVTLLFFLLVGRYLDRSVRGRARSLAEHLVVLSGTTATVLGDGGPTTVAVDALLPGMVLLIAPGDRVPADGVVIAGRSDIDASLVTGESAPVAVAPGTAVFAGTINRSGALRVRIAAAGEDTLLAEMKRLMVAAEGARARYVRLADRVARLYAPAVHVAAAAAFLFWAVVMASPWQEALLVAIAVLIVTCPCALGLAVPAVQVVAAGRLLRQGILLKEADALERLAVVDTVVFDKTGTLTTGDLVLANLSAIQSADLALAAGLALNSRHPLCRALVRAVPWPAPVESVREEPGRGLSATIDDAIVKLGSRAFVGAEAGPAGGPELWLARGDGAPVRFVFADALTDDAAASATALAAAGYDLRILSGDRPEVVAARAAELGIPAWQGGVTPAGKTQALAALRAEGRRVVMVGDGLNDAPALRAADASMSPSSAIDISQTAADVVFQGGRLAPVVETLAVARAARRRIVENFALAFLYNAVAVPLAFAGQVTPLIAALFMSASSIAVTANALRLSGPTRGVAR